jgi:hypothetical protein
MSILDASPRLQELSLRPQPGEGTHLPGYYELHRDALLAFGIIVAALVVAFIVGWLLWRYRRPLREAFFTTAAASLRAWRKMAVKGREVRSEILRRAG